MYRAYDIENKCWVKDDIYLSPSPNNDLYILKRGVIGKKKLILASSDKYIIHNEIGLYDKNNELVFEGDYVKAMVGEDREVVGLVVFAHELSSYVILCVDSEEYFTLGTEVSKYIEVVGNIFDSRKE